ncbi:unnamed protein product [Zymoseptoria tritici ST99CH_1A5]|uniref:Apc15p protein n=1 Tax=Zymoseptoria tritici ST99CH_1A5 TaxID=1276529 RepID=A0A1Y6LVR6_ZYMTR|nr:unnamed protein product [Zymoseptoria tritici ST99CH_1A5]
MFSLPLLPPSTIPSPHTLHHHRPRSPSPPPSGPQTARHRQSRDEAKRLLHARSALATLTFEESQIAARKTSVRTYGATWIRPPGVPKTLQAMTEEEAERVEAEEEERRARGVADLEAQQALQEAREAAEEAGEEGEGERDLDDDVPDAEEDAGDMDGEDEEDGTEERDLDDEVPDADDGQEEGTVGSVTFNEESMLGGNSLLHNGSPTSPTSPHYTDDEGDESNWQQQEEAARLEVAELTGAAQDLEDLGLDMDRDLDADEDDHGLGMSRDLDADSEMAGERNLDDSVPEAGSYQHTDTEASLSSDEESGLRSSFIGATRASARSLRSGRALRTPALDAQSGNGLQARMRSQVQVADGLDLSLNLSSSIVESSMVEGSSPVLQRNAGGRGRGARGRGGRMS